MSSEKNAVAVSGAKKRRGATFWDAFKNLAIVFSFFVNFVLVIVLLIVVSQILFPVKTDVVEPMLDKLQSAVDAVDTATIQRTISIDEQVPVSFTLPVETGTTVVLSQDVALVRPASFIFPGGGGTINGTVVLNLPQGLELPIVLDLEVPVRNAIPVQFPVEVAIPLKETELHHVVVKLNDVLEPVRRLLDDLPDDF